MVEEVEVVVGVHAGGVSGNKSSSSSTVVRREYCGGGRYCGGGSRDRECKSKENQKQR